MFILKLGAEALNIKSSDGSNFENSNQSEQTYRSTSSSPYSSSEMSQNLLESLLTKRNVSCSNNNDETFRPRCKSVNGDKDSAFLQILNESEDFSIRPKADTVPNLKSAFKNIPKKRVHPYQRPSSSNSPNSILYQHLTKVASVTHDVDEKKSQNIISIEELKQLRKDTNNLLKKVMMIIKNYTNYLSINEDSKIEFVSKLWYRLMVLLFIQMDTSESRSMFRLLLMSAFDSKSAESKPNDKIILLQKIQELVLSFQWIRENNSAFNCIIFWLLSKYGYPDLFQIPETAMFQLYTSTPILNPDATPSITQLLHSLHELESHDQLLQSLLCPHLILDPSTTVPEFLIQWT